MSSRDAVAGLVRLAEQRGLRDGDLDELVHDQAHAAAARAFNDGALPQHGDEAAYEQLHDDADTLASQINNAGLLGQLAYLLDGLGAAPLRHLLAGLADANSGRKQR
jgi:hypothetical protein